MLNCFENLSIYLRWSRYFLVIFCFVIPNATFAVPSVKYISHSDFQSASDVWNLQLVNDGGNVRASYIEVEVISARYGKIYEASSSQFLLKPGITNVNTQTIGNIQVTFSDPQHVEVKETDQLTLNINLMDPIKNILINTYTITIAVGTDAPKESDPLDTGFVKRNWSKSGWKVGAILDLSGSYNNRNDTVLYTPIDYLRTRLIGNIQAFSIPFKTDIYITTEQRLTEQQLNAYNFSFDYETFKQNMISKGKEKIMTLLTEKLMPEGQVSEEILKTLMETKSGKDILNQLTQQNLQDVPEALQGVLGDKVLQQKAELFELWDKYAKYLDYKDPEQLKLLLQEQLPDMENLIHEAFPQIPLEAIQSGDVEYFKTYLDSIPGITPEMKEKYIKSYELYQKFGAIDPEKLLQQLEMLKKIPLDELNQLKSIWEQYKDLEQYKDKLEGQMGALGIAEYKQYLDQIKDVNFDQLLQNPVVLEMLDERFGFMSKTEKLLNSVRDLGMGTVTPVYSKYSVNGAILQGYQLNFCRKKWYVGSSGGKSSNIYADTLFRDFSFDRNNLFAFAFGYGEKQGDHLHIHYVTALKNAVTNTETEEKNLARNQVLAPEFQTSLLKGRIKLAGEAGISWLKEIRNDIQIKQPIGYAIDGRVNVQLWKGADIQNSAGYVNPHFSSFGIPFLNNNTLNVQTTLTQSLLKYLVVSGGYQYEKYMSDSIRTDMSVLHSFPINAVFNYKGKFQLSAGYSPTILQSISQENISEKKYFHNFLVNAGTNYVIRDNQHSLLVGIQQNVSFRNEVLLLDNGNVNVVNYFTDLYRYISVFSNYSIKFTKKVTVNTDFSWQKSEPFNLPATHFITAKMGYNHQLNKKFTYGLGSQFTRDLQKSSRLGGYLSFNVPVIKYIEFNARFQYDYFKGIYIYDYRKINGVMIRAGCKVKF
ncbi:MAG: hypothetical protein K1X55_17145 [Chitinophagales bacterium]|nr:hypothetical protein [Chitinophagales bacterium]